MRQDTGGSKLIDVDYIMDKTGIGDKMKIADLGCGSMGRYVFEASKLIGKNGTASAVNILKPVLEVVARRARQENIANVKTIWSDLEIFGATNIESASLDVTLLINTLYQSTKRVEILREAIRLTKKNGRILIIEWKNVALPFGPPSEVRVKKEMLIEASKRLGLRLEEDFFAGQYHYGLIFTKL
jgi:ubiquinone/menaquinone biosynthesis C-methylase UbiE